MTGTSKCEGDTLLMTIDEMQKRRKELHYSYADLSVLTGIPFSTIQKILGGITKSPRYKTMQTLENALKPHRADVTSASTGASDEVCESAPPYQHENTAKTGAHFVRPDNKKYPRQGTYTLEDYYALPDDQRVELIDGVFYDMSSPLTVHQLIVGKLYNTLYSLQEKHPGCHAFVSPMDVQLDCDDRTMVEPDIFVICDRKKVTRRRIVGAPDFVIEVLSPSSRRKDIQIKLCKYGHAGVREYWMIDPEKKTVLAVSFENNTDICFYTFDDQIPIGISKGSETIDFREVQKEINLW